jgi:hypothetical protein
MLWAYFDETAVNAVHGKDGKLRPTEMFVGGCVATAPQWEKFTPKWRRALDRAGVVFTSMASIKDHGTRKAYQDAILRAFYDATKFRMRGKDSLYIVLARHPEFSPWSILRRFEQIDWESSSCRSPNRWAPASSKPSPAVETGRLARSSMLGVDPCPPLQNLTASKEMLFTPNFLLAPFALSEMN